MKNALLIVILAAATLQVNAQKISDKKVPKPVMHAFLMAYPGVSHAKWEKEKANYEVSFKIKNQEQSAVFDEQGNLLENERDIDPIALPAAAKEYVRKNYLGKKIKEAAAITLRDGTLNYEAEVEGSDLIFDAQGNFIEAKK